MGETKRNETICGVDMKAYLELCEHILKNEKKNTIVYFSLMSQMKNFLVNCTNEVMMFFSIAKSN